MITPVLGGIATTMSLINALPQLRLAGIAMRRGEKLNGVSATTLYALIISFILWFGYSTVIDSHWMTASMIVGIISMTVVLSATRTTGKTIVYGIGAVSAAVLISGAGVYASTDSLLGPAATVVSVGMFLPQAIHTIRSVMSGVMTSGVTITTASMQMILTPGSWMFYGLAIGAVWTWASAIPQIICGMAVVAALLSVNYRFPNQKKSILVVEETITVTA